MNVRFPCSPEMPDPDFRPSGRPETNSGPTETQKDALRRKAETLRASLPILT